MTLTKRNLLTGIIFLLFLICVCFWADDALAGDGIFTTFQNSFSSAAKNGMTSLKGYAAGLLGSLIVIDFVYVISNVALGDGLPLGMLFWRFIKWGLFVYLVQQFPTICTDVQTGFMNISSTMGLGTNSMMSDPSSFWDAAGAIYDKLKDNMTNIEKSFPGVLLITVYLFTIVGVYVLYFLLAATIVSATIVFWFCAAIGYCLFPFMVLDQTRMLAGNAPTAIIAGAVKLMMVNIVIGIGANNVFSKLSAEQIRAATGSSFNWSNISTVLSYGVYVALYLWTALKVPSVVTAAIVGSAGGGMGISGAVAKIGGAAVGAAKQAATFGIGMGVSKFMKGRKGGLGGKGGGDGGPGGAGPAAPFNNVPGGPSGGGRGGFGGTGGFSNNPLSKSASNQSLTGLSPGEQRAKEFLGNGKGLSAPRINGGRALARYVGDGVGEGADRSKDAGSQQVRASYASVQQDYPQSRVVTQQDIARVLERQESKPREVLEVVKTGLDAAMHVVGTGAKVLAAATVAGMAAGLQAATNTESQGSLGPSSGEKKAQAFIEHHANAKAKVAQEGLAKKLVREKGLGRGM